MPTVKKKLSLAAGAKNADVLQGTEFSTLPYDCYVDLWAVQDTGDILITLRATGLVLIDEGVPNVDANLAVNTQQDVLMAGEPLPAGTRMLFKADNSAGAGASVIAYLFNFRQA